MNDIITRSEKIRNKYIKYIIIYLKYLYFIKNIECFLIKLKVILKKSKLKFIKK